MITNELAKTAGVNSKAIRYYSRIGLLHPIRNPDNGYREYTTNDAARARFIWKAHWLGLTLKDVQTLLNEADSDRSACERTRGIVINRILENQQLLIHVQTIQKRMEAAVASWASIPKSPLHQEHVSDLIDSMECDQEVLSLHENYKFFECENYDNVAP